MLFQRRQGINLPVTQMSQATALLQLPKADPDLTWPCLLGALQEKVLLGSSPRGSRLKSSGSCNALISITNQINTLWPHQKAWRSGELIFIPMKHIKISSLLKEYLKPGDQHTNMRVLTSGLTLPLLYHTVATQRVHNSHNSGNRDWNGPNSRPPIPRLKTSNEISQT